MKARFIAAPYTARLVVSPGARTEVARRVARANVEQMERGLDGSGNPIPEGHDLKDTGELHTRVTADAEGYTFEAEHAVFVEDRFHFAGVPDSSLDQGNLVTDLEEILDRPGAVEVEED